MAGDNPKIGVDVDVEGAYRQGQQWGDNFMRGVNQKISEGGGIGGQVLGSGMPALGGGSPQNVSSLLSSILTTLQQGFGNLIAVSGGAGAPPPGGGAVTGQVQPQAQPPPGGPSGGGATFGSVAGKAVNVIDRALPSIANMVQTEFHRTGVYQALNAAFGDIPIVGKLFGIGADYAQAGDEFLSTSTNVMRAGGRDSRTAFRNIAGYKQGFEQLQRHGITVQEAANLYQTASSYGSYAADPLIAMQGRYALGGQSADLMKAMTQGGGVGSSKDFHFQAGGTEYKVFADAISVALTTNLDRGRWGEAFTAMTHAARRISTGDIDREGLVQMETFIGKMGPRFEGASAAHASMQQTLMGMQGGEGGGLAQIMALKAAGLGQPGVSYWDAMAKVDLGAAKGGVGLEQVIKQYARLPMVARYLTSGKEGDLNAAYRILATMMPHYKPTDIKEALKAFRAQAGAIGGPNERMRKGVEDMLRGDISTGFGGTDFLPKEEAATAAAAVAGSYKGPDYVGGANKDEAYQGRFGSGIGGVESLEEAGMRGWTRTGPDVQMVTQGAGDMEGYGATRDFWPMGRGDVQEKGLKPGWRKARPGDPRHMARDITIGNGKPGEKVYAPMAGVWLTNTPYLANRKEQKEGYIGEMLGDNGVRYKFMHLYFEPGLKKNKRIEAGELIGTVAEGTAGWTPHLHLEARKKIAGKTSVIDPVLEGGIDKSARDIMEGKTPVPRPSAPTPAPVFLDESDPSGGKPITDPGKVVPVSMRGGAGGGMEITINLSNEARRLLNVSVHRKPATRRGVVG